jgi:flotillin
LILGQRGCEGASPDTDGEGTAWRRSSRSVAANGAQGLQPFGDLTGVDVAALLRRLGGAAPAADGATRVPITTADGEEPTR